MTDIKVSEGGCLCGAIRYRVVGPIPPGGHCHCSMCRRASGAVALTWVSVPRQNFAFTDGEPSTYRSSAHAERKFCPNCGSPLTFYSTKAPEDIDITLATFDHPEDLRADRHIFAADRLHWLQLDDHLPDYPDWTPPDHGAPPK
jgi:hypothetical protein